MPSVTYRKPSLCQSCDMTIRSMRVCSTGRHPYSGFSNIFQWRRNVIICHHFTASDPDSNLIGSLVAVKMMCQRSCRRAIALVTEKCFITRCAWPGYAGWVRSTMSRSSENFYHCPVLNSDKRSVSWRSTTHMIYVIIHASIAWIDGLTFIESTRHNLEFDESHDEWTDLPRRR